MKIMSIVGARPQFVKAAVVSRALAAVGCREYLIHTGQHYDPRMSQVFFKDLQMTAPFLNLGVGSGTHGRQTAEMLWRLEEAMRDLSPDMALVYGDTNSTLAGALAAVKLNIPVAHVEAGARNFSLTIPEEVNRVLTDRLSALRFCVTRTNVENLRREGMESGVILTGDVMLDVFREHESLARQRIHLLRSLGVVEHQYVLATFHRPSNVDQLPPFLEVLNGLGDCGYVVAFPVHPRTRKALDTLPREVRTRLDATIRFVEPLGYLDMVCLELYCHCIVTDSGGVQREAYFAHKPCVTVFANTAWPETVEEGWNQLVSADSVQIAQAIQTIHCPDRPGMAFGNGTAAKTIASILVESIQTRITVDGCLPERNE